MLFPFLVATDGLDPDGRAPHSRDDEQAAEPDIEAQEESGPARDAAPPLPSESDPVVPLARYTLVGKSESDEPEPVEADATPPESKPPTLPETAVPEPVALVPEAAIPRAPAAPVESVRPALRDDALDRDSSAEVKPRSKVQRFVLAVLLIAAATLIGYVVSRPSGIDARNPDALARSVEAARELQFVLDTAEPLEARRFVRNEFGWRVGIPIFQTVTLQGVAVASVAQDVEVPVFLYADAEDREVAVFVYSYALLDQIPDRLTLARADLDDLALGEPVQRPVGPADALLWRDRDDIYIAVTALDAAALTGGLTMAR